MKKKKNQRPLAEEQERIIKQMGARIKALRIKKGHTSYEDFAYENNISRSQFGKYERGADIRITSLIKVLMALEVSIEEFFSEGFE